MSLVSVIMAGGAGTRFWPVSTEERPKQFLSLVTGSSLLQESYARVRDLTGPERTLVFTHAAYVPQVREQLPELPAENVIGEPSRRDTAAVNALAALTVARRFGNPVLAILTADHWIRPMEAFHDTVRAAAAVAASGDRLCTLGIRPTWPATCYGYLHTGERLSDGSFGVRRFKEKPDLGTAREYVESGEYLWNSGMFFWTAQAILNEYRRHLPEHLAVLEPALESPDSLPEAFERLQKISVDYAILEKAERVVCVVPSFDWSDLGGWLALEPFMASDAEENVHRGRLASLNARRNLVFCEDPEELVALLGVENLIVVRSGAHTLIMTRESTEEVKQLLSRLQK